MKTGRRKVLAVLVVLLLVAMWTVSFTGIGNKLGNLGKELKYGLDINGGVYVLLEADTKETGTELTAIMNQTKSVLENRVNAMGISEAQVSIEGTNRIRVEMPGVENAEEAIEQIGRTAQLQFFLADGTLALTGDGIKDSQMATDTQNGGYKITIDFTAEGSDAFADATEKAYSGQIEATMTDEDGNTVSPTAIVIALDDEVISAPTVQEKINSRSCEITRPGGFSETEASQLSALIRGGALPANLTEINSSVQTATIGANALQLSVKAGAIGLALVLVLMILVYGILGFVADLALLLYIQLVLWIMAGIGSVLTLPGIAGIILSIGMAVDSNVIIFTRIREEIQKGKSVKVAVDMGYHAALSTVVDSQTTTLVAAFVLYLFGTTSVKGFALTLMIGTVMSVITAVFITQLFVNLLADSKTFGTNKMFGCKEDGSPKFSWKWNIKFIENRKKFYALSACVIIIGLGFSLVKGFNYGIDFTGGTMMQIELGQEVTIDEVKDTIAEYDLDPTIVYASDNNSQIIIRTIKDLKSAERTKVVNTLQEKYGFSDDDVLASEEFGPTVGKDLRNNAIKSILIAAICMLIYIRFRFKDWRYGLAAVAGLAHDVLVTLSIYAIFRITINNPFIAGILTVVGYSINDTIVVFDRIRENSKFYKRKQSVALIDDSINQTLSRTIMTSLTTFLVMVPLYVMASSELRGFLIPLMIGVFVGTYSSIFLCSPVFYELTKKEGISKYEDNKAKADKARRRSSKRRDDEGIRL
ncbi:MAG: protein translocase subunit SecF [Clostridiales bacterium]|jgi:SecD/SecF fusion protein|nr:protein translocase subunit SecF [Clostridiales bacterium]